MGTHAANGRDSQSASTIPAIPPLSNMNLQTSAATTVGKSPREQHDYARDPAASRQRIERQSERHPEDDLDRHAHTCEEHRVHDGLPQPLIGKRGAVVVEPDEGPPEPRHSQVVEVQRLPDSGQERPDGDGTQQEQRRQEQGPRETPVLARC